MTLPEGESFPTVGNDCSDQVRCPVCRYVMRFLPARDTIQVFCNCPGKGWEKLNGSPRRKRKPQKKKEEWE